MRLRKRRQDFWPHTRPVGLIDVTDVVGMFPEIEEHGSERAAKPEDRVFREQIAV